MNETIVGPALTQPQVRRGRPIGRGDQLERAREARLAAASGDGRTLLISGDAGIGKTSIVRAIAADARRDGVVLLAECFELEATVPFAPFDALVERVCSLQPDGAADLRRSRAARAESRGPDTVERSRTALAWASALKAIASREPLTLVIDDIHWADDASLELLSYLARKLEDSAVLIVAAFRQRDPQPSASLARLRDDLLRRTRAIDLTLDPFSVDDASELISAELGIARVVDRYFAARIHQRSEGNPLLISEIVRGLVQAGAVYPRDGAWYRRELSDELVPSSVAATVRARLASMPAPIAHVLRAAAVLGSVFREEDLSRVAELPAEDARAAVRAGVDAGLIESVPGGERYDCRFRHVLVRDALEETLLARERAALHAAVASALEGVASHAELAHHYEVAGDAAPAARHHAAAALDAYRASTNDAMLVHSERALALAPAGVLSAGQFIPLMAAWYQQADPERALRFAEGLLRLCVGDEDRLARGRLLTFRGLMLDAIGRADESMASCQQAVAELEPLGDSGALARALANLASKSAEIDDALPLARRAVEVAERVEPGPLGYRDGSLAHSEGVYAAALIRSGQFAEGLAVHAKTAREERSLLDVEGVPVLALLNSLEIGSNCVRGAPGVRAQLVATREEVIARARSLDARSRFVALAEERAALDRGDWDECIALLAELGFDGEPPSGAMALRTLLMRVMRDGPPGHVAQLDACGERSLGAGPVRLHGAMWATATALAAGDPTRVLRLASLVVRAFDGLVVMSEAPQLAMGTIIHALTAARLSGDEDAWAAWARSADQVARRAPLVADVLDAFVTAEGAAQSGENDAADSLLRCAERIGDFEQPFLERLIRLRRVEVLAAGGDRPTAQAELDGLVAYWRAARADWYLSRLATDLSPLGLVVRTEARRAAPAARGPVTRREREVARLVADGLTNKQIAERLGISVRTAETHVEQLRTKLGFSSRSQIAAWVAQRSAS